MLIGVVTVDAGSAASLGACAAGGHARRRAGKEQAPPGAHDNAMGTEEEGSTPGKARDNKRKQVRPHTLPRSSDATPQTTLTTQQLLGIPIFRGLYTSTDVLQHAMPCHIVHQACTGCGPLLSACAPPALTTHHL
jgi:hypothetical protein